MNVLEIKEVSKQFGTKKVLNQLSFSIPKGSIFGFVGENGAGKTTLMKLILGLDNLTAGEIYINGQQVHFGETKTNQMTGYLPDVPEFYDYMNSTEYLMLCAEITKIDKKQRRTRVEEMLELVGLANNYFLGILRCPRNLLQGLPGRSGSEGKTVTCTLG